MIPSLYILRLLTVLSLLSEPLVYAWINYPPEGTATLTHYDLPKVRVNDCSTPFQADSRYIAYPTGLYRCMRMHWKIHTLPYGRLEPDGIRKQPELRTRLREMFQADLAEFVHGFTPFLPEHPP